MFCGLWEKLTSKLKNRKYTGDPRWKDIKLKTNLLLFWITGPLQLSWFPWIKPDRGLGKTLLLQYLFAHVQVYKSTKMLEVGGGRLFHSVCSDVNLQIFSPRDDLF